MLFFSADQLFVFRAFNHPGGRFQHNGQIIYPFSWQLHRYLVPPAWTRRTVEPNVVLRSMTSNRDRQERDDGVESARHGQRSQVDRPRRPRPRYHLVVHFDINETILVGDEAGGDSREDCLQKMIAKSAFVQIPEAFRHSLPAAENQNDSEYEVASSVSSCRLLYEHTYNVEPTHWWDGTPLCLEGTEAYRAPTTGFHGALARSESIVPPPLWTAWDWPEHCCPYYRTKFKVRAQNFTSHHGNIYQSIYDQLVGNLHLPKKNTQIETTLSNAVSSTLLGESSFTASASLWEHEHPILAHMIPAFFETIIQLSKTQEEQPFTLVFRTFGTDLADVMAAVSDFACGNHPSYPYFRNPRLVLFDSKQQLLRGRWKRITTTAATTVAGSQSKKCNQIEKDNLVYELFTMSCLEDNSSSHPVLASGDAEVLRFLQSQSMCGIQDDYEFWRDHHFEPWAGKPIWIPSYDDRYRNDNDDPFPKSLIDCNSFPDHDRENKADTLAGETSESSPCFFHHVLFDDNIHNLDTWSIASVRRQQLDGTSSSSSSSFEFMAATEIRHQHGLHLIRVPTVEPILNPHWFWQHIQQAKQRFYQQYGLDG